MTNHAKEKYFISILGSSGQQHAVKIGFTLLCGLKL